MQSNHKPDRLEHHQRAIGLQYRGMRLARDPVHPESRQTGGPALPDRSKPPSKINYSMI
jgi:hypothetical protein